MHPNGTTAPPRPAADDPAAGDVHIPLNDEWRAFLADLRWINEEYGKGTFDEFRGEFVAVVDKKVLGHGKNLRELKDAVAEAAGAARGRIATRLIIRNPIGR